MKVYLILAILSITQVFAQNLVPNGGFESGNYNGGSDPTNYYSGVSCSAGRELFESDLDDWYVAKPTSLTESRCSPDWIPGGMTIGEGGCAANDNYYVRSALLKESIMVELVGGYKLVKGTTYHFRIKVRAPKGPSDGSAGSFQVVFSTKEEGLRVNVEKKWVALDFYLNQTCEWRFMEGYFTVPNDNENDYEDMKYMVLQYNHEQSSNLTLNYDDVSLVAEEKCIDIKYIQDWQYYAVHKIEQANVEIKAGAHVSPYAWQEEEPVIVRSSAKVIYRAPAITLEPGFFIEEPGSYFETQNGTCVDDPCPPITPYTLPPTTLCGGQTTTLGQDIVSVPGVFYEWQPNQYFSSPWSRETNFTPPSGSGCVDAKLVIWTICGASQAFNFQIKYYDSPPIASFSNVVSNPNLFELDVNVQNASSYHIQAINTNTNEILYDATQTVGCQINATGLTHLKFTPCNFDMCSPIQVTVTAENTCFGSVSQTVTWIPPAAMAPAINVSNLISNNFNYNFDLSISNSFEYLLIEVLDASTQGLICSKLVKSCELASNVNNYHYDIKSCLTGCLSQCKNYDVRITVKNVCYATPAVQVLHWYKSSTSFAMPTSYPNVITLNGDGINETLCFTPQAADYYYIVVTNRWGNVMYESSGCITSYPVCLWTPQSNISDGVYFYIIGFGNQCGNYQEAHNFVHVFNDLDGMIKENDANTEKEENLEEAEKSMSTILNAFIAQETDDFAIFPNPVINSFTINLGDSQTKVIQVYGIDGNLIQELAANKQAVQIDLSAHASGVYVVKLISDNQILFRRIIKQ